MLAHCDRCGVSKLDGTPIVPAKFRVKTPKGELFFCLHHFRKHRAYFAAQGYETYEVK
jgi:hypothetical protein